MSRSAAKAKTAKRMVLLSVLGLTHASACGTATREPQQISSLAPKTSAKTPAPASRAPNAAMQPTPAEAPQREQAETAPSQAEPTVEPASETALADTASGPERTTSIGAPGAGELRGGMALPVTGPGFIHNPKRPPEARYATHEVVSAIRLAAADVDAELPGSKLVVNDLSLPHGGPIAQHGSHQSGRDADILFYVLDEQGKPLPSVGVPLDPDGRGFDFKDLSTPADDQPVRLDATRTMRFMGALIEHAGDDVQRIFIAEHIRTLLLAAAERARVPKAVRERFELLTCQPGTPHDDHMHVRFYCTPEDLALGCIDSAPTYPFRRQALAALGLSPIVERAAQRTARRKEVTNRTTSPAQARAKAGPMHARVRQFLARREAWLPQPRPGRPFCR